MNAVVDITVNGSTLQVREGTSLASAILNAGAGDPAWTPVCGMGVCWGCRVTVDGRADRRACLESVVDGMQVTTSPLQDNTQGLEQHCDGGTPTASPAS
ncbi:MAG: (2Fe-2S)-binding protein [Alphaproteobacteria bacterium]